MHPLGRLLEQRMDHPDHRWSVRDVERQAREQGESLNRTTVNGLRKKMTPSITRANVFGLAAGLRVTPLTVATAALESWGIRTRPDEVTDSLATIAIDPTLSERDKRQLRTLIAEMRDMNRGDGHVVPAVEAPQSDAQTEAVKGEEVGLLDDPEMTPSVAALADETSSAVDSLRAKVEDRNQGRKKSR